jgi:hypothetical protein
LYCGLRTSTQRCMRLSRLCTLSWLQQ